jgi:tRNA(Ile)-lysidine synthetase-like protein
MIITDEMFSTKIGDSLKGMFVVGLSGGPDSLCLTLLSSIYAKAKSIDLYAGIVDHKLRPESSTEILPIIDILKDFDIKYRVLVWEHEKDISGNLEKKAREARYKLLYEFTKTIGGNALLTAHHSLDQWETFFMRLSRGSALKGLSSIRPTSCLNDIKLIRPLLDFTREDIKETLHNRFGITEYVNDPMNKQIKYERVFWRESYNELSNKYNMSLQNINKVVERIQRADDCLNSLALKYTNAIFNDDYINREQFTKINIELQIRILDNVIHTVSSTNQIISNTLLERTAKEITDSNFKATNLAGVVLKKDRTKNIRVYKENRYDKENEPL